MHVSFSFCIWKLCCIFVCGLYVHSHIGSQYMVSCLYTVLAVERVAEEDVTSGVYNFPAQSNINGNHPTTLLLYTRSLHDMREKSAPTYCHYAQHYIQCQNRYCTEFA